MDNIHGSEWLMFMVMMVHLILAPFTKVEESFNVQAVHDILYLGRNVSQYDHLRFPGVVPRTFLGSLYISTVMSPLYGFLKILNVEKMWILFAVRFTLGLTVLLAFCGYARTIGNKLGSRTSDCLRIITATQFHFIYYSTRPLPNTFALVLVLLTLKNLIDRNICWATRYATVAVLLFRFELVLLFGPLFLWMFARGTAPFWSTLNWGVRTGIMVIGLSVPIDSVFWNRWVWPEGEVIWFNLVLNKSHEYGVMPFFWYFTSAIPRALLTSILLIPFGLLMERRIRSLFVIAITFIFLYSFLPHKELRFIIYVFPLLNLPAACLLARFWNNLDKSWFYCIVGIGMSLHLLANLLLTGMFLYASARNYPGGDALAHLQHIKRFERDESRSVHIDVYCAQTGVNRFVHFYPSWEYNKTEDLTAVQLHRFDFILLGSSKADDLMINFETNFSKTHRELFTVDAFHKISYKRSKKFPYIYPLLKFKQKILALTKIDLY